MRVHPDTITGPSRYSRRDLATGGLNKRQRRAMLARWQSQGRTCAYCPSLADTVDHVVPLSCGGTNWEGNLVPACKPCNSAKGDRFLIEWRTGKHLPKRRHPAPLRKRRPKPTGEQIALFAANPCGVCGGPIPSDFGKQHGHRSTYCSGACRAERNARDARDKQRVKRGKPPLGPDAPTSVWPRRQAAAAQATSREETAA